MVPKTKNVRHPKGVSLVGTMVSITVLSIAIIGTANFRYYATLDSRRAAMYSTAARLAVIFDESWRAVGGADTYDPVAHLGSDLTISQLVADDIEYDETFTLLGSYTVVLNGTVYNATLFFKDVSPGLRALNVVITWPPLRDREASVDRSFRLTTYAITG